MQKPALGEHIENQAKALPVVCPARHRWRLNRGWVGGSSVWILDKLTDDFALQFGFLPFFFRDRILGHTCTSIEQGMGLVETRGTEIDVDGGFLLDPNRANKARIKTPIPAFFCF